jgi:hypothetical protein
MKISTFITRYIIAFVLCLSLFIVNAFGQRNYATNQRTGTNGICLFCSPNNAANAADGNVQTFSQLNVTVGLGAQSWQELIFPGSGKVAANIPVTVKLGTGNNLIDLTLLGGTLLQAYNGNSAIGQPVAASTLLSVLSNNNQTEVTFTPNQTYDRIRVTLDAGLLGAGSSIYVYDAFYNGTGAVACNTAVDELHGISSNLLNLGVSAGVGGVDNPQNAIDGNLTTASTLNAGIGVVGGFAQQTVIFSNTSVIGDSVRLTMALPQALIDAGVLANISILTYNGNTSNNDPHTFNDALLSLRLLDLTGPTRKVTVTYAPTAVFDRIQLRLGSGIASLLSSLNLYEAQRVIPRPVIKFNNTVTNNVQTCAGSAVTLVANAVPNTIFRWYDAPTGGTLLTTGANYTSPNLTANTTYYVEAMRAGCTDASDRTPVTVTVNAIPIAPVVVNSAITVCQGSPATFAAQTVAGITVNWYAAPTGGTPLFSGDSFTTPALTATTTYYAEATAGGGQCISATRTAVTATVSTPPANPALTNANLTICDGDVAVLTIASPVSGVVYNWYSTATGGTILHTGENFTTAALHNNTNYYVEAVNSTGCASAARAQATVTVQPKPADPVLMASSTTVSAGQPATIAVSNSATGITYNWYTSATAASPVFTGVTYVTPPLYTTTTYYVSAVNSTSCQSVNRTAITINVTINNNSPCSFAKTQTNSTTGICVGCSVENQALSVDADTTTASTLHLVLGVGGSVEQTVAFQNPGFAGDTIKLGLQSPVGLADVGVLSSIRVTFYNGATAGTSYLLNNSLLTLRLLGANKYNVYVPAAEAYDRISIQITGTVSALNALSIYYAQQQFSKPVFNPTNPEICKGSKAVINITSPANGGTFAWFTTPTGGTAVGTGTTFTTDPLNANAVYYVEYTRNACVSPVRFPVNVLVDDVPLKPVAAFNSTTITSGQTATLTATAANNATVKWYADPTGGPVLFTGNNFTTPALTANTTYYAESSLGNCVSIDRTPVTVNVTAIVVPDITVTPPTAAINPGTTASFTASSTTPGTIFNWYTDPTGGTSIYTGANFTSPALFANTTYYAEAVVQATGVKSATRAPAAVTINAINSSAVPCDAAIAQDNNVGGLLCVLCGVNNAPAAVDADRNTFSQLNVAVGVAAYTQQTLRFASTGRAGDSVVVELGVPGTLASVGVLSSISLATYNGTTYNGDRFNVDGSLISVTVLGGQTRFKVAFKAGQDFDRVEIRLNGVANVLNTLNVYDAAQEVAAPVITTASVTACAGSQATLTATVPSHVTVKWYTSPTGGTPVFTGATFTTPVLNANTTYYAEASRTGDGCAQAVRTPATVTINPVPVPPVVPVPTVTTCAGQPATFAVTPVAGVTYNWFAASSGGTALFTGTTFVTPNLSATTSYYVEASNGSCGNSTRTQVTANVNSVVLDPSVAQTTVQTCSGSSATLTATSAQPGVTFRWYTDPTGGIPVFTGAQFTTPPITSNTSYYVDAAAGTCVSANRVKVDVTANPAPAAPTVAVNPASGQINSGQTATFTASSTTAGATINWYTTSTGGSPVATGATFTTPALTSSTTYYAESALATGCVSARTAVNITVVPVFVTTCDFASSETHQTNGVCLLCGVTDGSNAVDADLTNFTHLHTTISALGGSVSQNLIFGETATAADSISVLLRLPSPLLSVGLLSSITITSFNGGVSNNDGVSLDNNLITLKLLADGQTVLVKFKPGNTYDRVEVKLAGGILSAFTDVDVFYASKQVEAPQLTATTVNACAGSPVTFTVSNARAGVTYNWYNAATGGTLLASGTSFTPSPSPTVTTTYYVESARTATNCPNPNRVAATANITPSPVPPVLAATNPQVCAGDNVILAVTNAGTNTVKWYDAPTGGNLVFTGANFQVTPIVTVSYYVELSNGTCSSPARVTATVTVNPRPAKPGVQSANVDACIGGTAVLSVLNPEAGVTYNWYDAATGGTQIGTGIQITSPVVTASASYYVEAVSATGTCINNGGRTQVNVNTNGVIANPTLSATATTVCYGGSTSISVVNPVTGITYKWYTDPTGGAAVFTGTTFTLNNLTANATYYVEASNSTGCLSASRTRTDITVQPIPTPPTVVATAGSLSVCVGSGASISIDNPQVDQVYRWFSAATNGTLLFVGTQFNTPALTTNTTYYVEASTAGNCNPSARTAVTITVNDLPTDPTLVSANVLVCAGSPATFKIASPQAGVIYQWFDSPAKTNKLFEGSTFITSPITVNTTFYVSAVNISGCSSTNLTSATATIQATPPAPIIANGSTVQDCAGSQVTLSISNPQPGYTYNWYDAAAGGTLITNGPSFTTAALTGNITYYAEAVNSTGCISTSRTQVTINVNPLPVSPVVTAQGGSTTPSICAGTTVTLNATSTTAGVTFNWYTEVTGGTMVYTGATYTTGPLTANIIYYVEAVNGTTGCISSTRTAIPVTVITPPATPVPVNATVAVCAGGKATLSVSSPLTGITYNWYDSANKTTLLFTGATYVTGPQTTNATYYVEASNGSCNSSTLASVQVNVTALPGTPTLVNNNVASCAGAQATLAIANPQTGITYSWYTAATGGNAVFTGTSFTTAALNTTTTYYAEAANAGGCTSATRVAGTVTVNPLPASPTVTAQGGSTTPAICAGNVITLNATSTTAGATFNWYTVATGGTPVFVGASFTTAQLSGNVTYYVEAVGVGGCASSTRTAISVTVNAPPTVPVPVAAAVTVCAGSPATLAVASPITGVTYNWYNSANKTTLLFTGPTYVTGAQTVNATYYVEASNGTCTSSTLASVQVNVSALPGAPTVLNSSVSACPNTQVVLSVANPQSGFTYSWYSGSAGGTALFTGTSFTTPQVTASTTYYVEAVNGNGCPSTSRAAVNVILAPAPVAPQVSTQGTDVCAGSATTISAASVDPATTIRWYAAATGGNALGTGTTFTTRY